MSGKAISSVLIYGVSGVGKTTQLGEAALFIYGQTKKKLRLISASGGGWTTIEGLVDMGLIEPIFILDRPAPFETLYYLTKGYWPSYPSDPSSPLLRPEDQTDYADVGGLAFDSMTEMAEMLMSYSIAQEAAGKIKISGQSPAARFMDGKMFFGSSSMGMYGTVQNYIAQFVKQSKAHPDKWVFWTALEKRVTDSDTRMPAYGPDVIGDAKTTVAPAWFDNVLHLYYVATKGGEGKRRLYLTKHFEDGVPFLAKNTASMYAPLPEFLEGDALSLQKFFQLLEESKQNTITKLRNEGLK